MFLTILFFSAISLTITIRTYCISPKMKSNIGAKNFTYNRPVKPPLKY